MDILEALEKFIIQLEADGRSHHTIKQYQRHVRLLARDVGPCGDVSAISHEDIARFLISPLARTRPDGRVKKATSVNSLRTSLKGFFQYLHKAGYTNQDPSRLTRRAICGQAPPRGLNNEEKERLMDALLQGTGYEARRDYALFHLMLATGIRIGSALSLDKSDVDLDRGEVWLMTAKGNRPERVILGCKIKEHIRGYVAERFPGPLFTDRAGRRLTTRHVQRRFSQWLKKAGIKRPASPHSLRHTFAYHIYKQTHDLLLTKAALGHRSIMSTLVYARADEERLRRVLEG